LTLLISQKNENRRRPLSTHQSAEGAWLSGGQPQLPKALRYRRKCCIVNEQTGETGYFFSVFFDELDSDFDESDPDSALGLLSFFASESLPESLFDSEPELEADPPAGYLASSVTYQPDPLNRTAGAETSCSIGPPHSGHFFTCESENFWIFSKRW